MTRKPGVRVVLLVEDEALESFIRRVLIFLGLTLAFEELKRIGS